MVINNFVVNYAEYIFNGKLLINLKCDLRLSVRGICVDLGSNRSFLSLFRSLHSQLDYEVSDAGLRSVQRSSHR